MIDRLSGRQFDYIGSLLEQLGISQTTALHCCPGIIHDYPGGPPNAVRDLTMTQASNLLDYLIAIREGHKPMPVLPGQTSLPMNETPAQISHDGRWGFEEVRTYYDDSVYGNGFDSTSHYRIYLSEDPSHTVSTAASYRTASEMVAIHNQAVVSGASR